MILRPRQAAGVKGWGSRFARTFETARWLAAVQNIITPNIRRWRHPSTIR